MKIYRYPGHLKGEGSVAALIAGLTKARVWETGELSELEAKDLRVADRVEEELRERLLAEPGVPLYRVLEYPEDPQQQPRFVWIRKEEQFDVPARDRKKAWEARRQEWDDEQLRICCRNMYTYVSTVLDDWPEKGGTWNDRMRRYTKLTDGYTDADLDQFDHILETLLRCVRRAQTIRACDRMAADGASANEIALATEITEMNEMLIRYSRELQRVAEKHQYSSTYNGERSALARAEQAIRALENSINNLRPSRFLQWVRENSD